jgi:hypothetical protein
MNGLLVEVKGDISCFYHLKYLVSNAVDIVKIYKNCDILLKLNQDT